MARINDIMKVNKADADLVKEQSAVLLQKTNDGFNGELKTSGCIIENYLKFFLKKHLPSGYRICSGYIATTTTISNSKNLIQHDIIIVDSRIPSIYVFGISDIEVVPAEAVCGIFEIKRTLKKESVQDAISHLLETKNILDSYKQGIKSKKCANNMAAGPSLTVATTAPMYGILALDAVPELAKEDFGQYVLDFVDIIWAISKPYLVYFSIKDNNGQEYFPQNISRNHPGYQNACCRFGFSNDLELVFAKAISYFRIWINNTSGQCIDSNDTQLYFGIDNR